MLPISAKPSFCTSSEPGLFLLASSIESRWPHQFLTKWCSAKNQNDVLQCPILFYIFRFLLSSAQDLSSSANVANSNRKRGSEICKSNLSSWLVSSKILASIFEASLLDRPTLEPTMEQKLKPVFVTQFSKNLISTQLSVRLKGQNFLLQLFF